MALTPTARLPAAVTAAQQAYQAALALPVAPRLTINGVWHDFVARQRAAARTNSCRLPNVRRG